jgi:hypothetical protein
LIDSCVKEGVSVGTTNRIAFAVLLSGGDGGMSHCIAQGEIQLSTNVLIKGIDGKGVAFGHGSFVTTDIVTV